MILSFDICEVVRTRHGILHIAVGLWFETYLKLEVIVTFVDLLQPVDKIVRVKIGAPNGKSVPSLELWSSHVDVIGGDQTPNLNSSVVAMLVQTRMSGRMQGGRSPHPPKESAIYTELSIRANAEPQNLLRLPNLPIMMILCSPCALLVLFRHRIPSGCTIKCHTSAPDWAPQREGGPERK